MLYIEYNSIFDSIRSKKIFSIHNILQQIDNNLIGCKSEKDYSKHIDFDRKKQWNQMVDRGMQKDFSWNTSKRRYEEIYDYLINR